jgi:acyl carrier protein
MNASELKPIILSTLAAAVPGVDVSILGDDDDMRETLDIDSFDALQFFIGLNEKLGFEIPEKDYGKLYTTNQIIQYLAGKI